MCLSQSRAQHLGWVNSQYKIHNKSAQNSHLKQVSTYSLALPHPLQALIFRENIQTTHIHVELKLEFSPLWLHLSIP